MKPIISEFKQKVLSSAVSVLLTFAGFEALSYLIGRTYQLEIFAGLALNIYILHLIWLIFLFDLHLRKRAILLELAEHKGFVLFQKALALRVAHLFQWTYFRHYLNFLILPSIVFWSVVTLICLNPFNNGVKQAVIVFASLCMSVAYWHFKESFNRRFEVHHLGIKILNLVKILAAFLFFAAVLGFTFYFGYGPWFLGVSVFAGSFILVYQALFQHKLFNWSLFWPVSVLSLIVGLTSFAVFSVWSSNYLTGAVIILAVYNTCWGILHHYLDKDLTQKLVYEYVLLMILAVSVMIASHDFVTRIE
ncbi:MAG: hypothetical protein ACM3KM_01640 [Acidobacteriaceae bacterium]